MASRGAAPAASTSCGRVAVAVPLVFLCLKGALVFLHLFITVVVPSVVGGVAGLGLLPARTLLQVPPPQLVPGPRLAVMLEVGV